jgi:hypothetical protein
VRNAYWVKRSRRAFRSTPPLDAAADDVAANAFAAPFTVEVSNAKGATLLRVVVKGTGTGSPKFQLTSEEQACSVREPLWRLLVVSDAGTAIAQHKIYKPSEMSQAPGFEAQG